MGKQYQKDDPIWRNAFGNTLKKILTLFSIDYHHFCEKYNISEATFRYWMLGKNYLNSNIWKKLKNFYISIN